MALKHHIKVSNENRDFLDEIKEGLKRRKDQVVSYDEAITVIKNKYFEENGKAIKKEKIL